jgi:hypothetical protein
LSADACLALLAAKEPLPLSVFALALDYDIDDDSNVCDEIDSSNDDDYVDDDDDDNCQEHTLQ